MSSKNLMNEEGKEILYIKTKFGFIFKIVAELLSNNIKNSCFVVNKDGIFLNGMDHDKSILINLKMFKANFNVFNFTPPELDNPVILLGLNTSIFYKVLKSIKKKDIIVLKITDDQPNVLKIQVEHPEDGNSVLQTRIKFIKIHPEDIMMPSDYKCETIVGGKEFQKLAKNLSTIGKDVIIFSQENGIRFYCEGGELCDRDVCFGKYDIAKPNEYQGTLNTCCITQLMKIASLSTNVQIFTDNKLPLKIKMQLGMLGMIEVYLKSLEEIELDKPESLS